MLSFRQIKLRDVLTKSLGNGFQIAEISKDPMHCTWRDKPTCRYQGKLQFVKSNTKWRENGCPSKSNLWFCWLFLRFRYMFSLRHVNHQKEYILLTQKNGVRLLKESHTFIVTTPRDPFIVPSLYSRVSYPYCYCLYHGMSQFQRNQ